MAYKSMTNGIYNMASVSKTKTNWTTTCNKNNVSTLQSLNDIAVHNRYVAPYSNATFNL